MPLRIQDPVDGWYDVTGVAGDQTVRAPLGQRYFEVGPHVVGFDQRFSEPVVVRSYYQPDRDGRFAAENQAGRALDHLGYVQAAQLTYAGTPIPPDVFGGRIGDRWPYVDGEYRFLDFMGPADARARGMGSFPPFYAFNGVLSDGTLRTTDDFFRASRVNGSLWAPPSRPVANLPDAQRSAVASIVAEVATGTISVADVEAVLSDDNVLLVLNPGAVALRQTEGYRLVLDRLRTARLDDAPPDSGPPLAGVGNDEIIAQLVGPYVLLTLPADDGFPETLCVREDVPAAGQVTAHLLNAYDLDEVTRSSGMAVLDRIGTYLAGTGQLTDIEPPPDVPMRGRADPGGEPVLVNDATRLRCELRYWTFVVGMRNRKRGRRGDDDSADGQLGDRMSLLGGFTWSALYRFDPDLDVLELAALREPEATRDIDLAVLYAAYLDGLGDRFADLRIDTSNFTGAALRRDAFGAEAGEPVPFVDANHRDIDSGEDLDSEMDLDSEVDPE
ncbi:hypothetical protein [Parafrankia elaeagni]|uniref:hypothetical protein n=1 Tax=Parafrankia elaeagni TaxID=222534 RepID=UPI0012B62454|nr:hypothetical protein [Parafrankia elaeagni]